MSTTATNVYASGGLQPAFPKPDVLPLAVKLKPNTAFPAGCVLGEITATPGVYGPYAAANADGTQIPKGLLKYGCTTDANGNYSLGEYDLQMSAPAFFVGSFYTADLPQAGAGAIDANAVTAGTWRIVQGSVVSGILTLS